MTSTPVTAGISLSAKTALALAAAHIWHFDQQLDHPGPGVRHADTRYYLELWKEIRTLVNRGQELGSEHLAELHDAVTSREYDGLLTSDELLSVLGSIARPTDCVVSETARAS